MGAGTLDGKLGVGKHRMKGQGSKTRGDVREQLRESHRGDGSESKVPAGTSSSQGETRLETIISSAWA